MRARNLCFLDVFRALGLAGVIALGACGDRDVVAKVGGAKIHLADVEVQLGGRTRGDPVKVLDAIVARAVLAEAARDADIDEDPRVRARLAQAEREILAQAYLEKVVASATREDVLLKRYQETQASLARRRIHVAHVAIHVVRSDPGSVRRGQSEVARVVAHLAGKEPFEKVAKELSDDKLSAPKGGDLGPLLEGEVDPAFFEPSAALRKGEVSRPIETTYGWHVVTALEDPARIVPSFEEVKGRLAADARNEAQRKIEDEQRARVGVKLYPERLPPAAKPSEAAPSTTEGR